MTKNYCLEVRGDYACFTRPEMKVERVSYDVITPSAARAVFEAILWKPAIRWRITKIEVLKPIKWISVRRNEVGAVVSTRNAESAAHSGKGNLGLNIEAERKQRAGLFLRNVAYLLYADLELLANAGENNTLPKFMDMFERRAKAGQCINQPYLGTREFACDFELIDEGNKKMPINETREFGWMLHDMDFSKPSEPQPQFYRVSMVNGAITVPSPESDEVRG